jgi:Protein of unknown function (DUF3039)
MLELLDAPSIEETDETDPNDKLAHIVKGYDRDVNALILEARVMGFKVEALCGYQFIPKRDASSLPICPKCLEIHKLNKMLEG